MRKGEINSTLTKDSIERMDNKGEKGFKIFDVVGDVTPPLALQIHSTTLN